MTDDRSFLKVGSLGLAACTSRFFGAFRDFDPKKKSYSIRKKLSVHPPSLSLTIDPMSQLDLTLGCYECIDKTTLEGCRREV